MPGLNELLFGVLVPALVCGLLLAAVWSSRASGVNESHARRGLQALALAAGVLAAYHAVAGMPVLPSANRRLAALDWVPWLVIAVALVSLVQTTRAGRRVPLVLCTAFSCALVVVMSFASQFANGPRSLAPLVCAVVLFIAWRSTEGLARRITGPGVPAALLVVATGTSLAALFSSSAKIAQISGGLAACLGAAVVVALWNPLLCIAGGGVAVTLTVLGSCWINAIHYAELPPLAGVLLVVALLAPWAVRLWRFDASGGLMQALVCAALAAAPAAAAVVIAHASAPDTGY